GVVIGRGVGPGPWRVGMARVSKRMAGEEPRMKGLLSLPARDRLGVLVVVETPAGARAKLKYEPSLGRITWSRPLPLGFHYPFDFGFVPSTLAADGDPLDPTIFAQGPAVPGAVVHFRLLGVLEVERNRKSGRGRERNDRLLVAPSVAEAAAAPRDVRGIPPRVRAELEGFFAGSTRWEHKDLRFLGWKGPR